MRSLKFKSNSLDDTITFAENFATDFCLPGRLIGFNGNLAAGKTLIISQIINSFFDKKIIVSSPTFNYLNYYHAKSINILHADFYLLSNPDYAYNFAIEEYLSDHLCLIEWPNKGQLALNYDIIVDISFDKNNPNVRNLCLEIYNSDIISKNNKSLSR